MLTKEEIIFRHLNNRSIELGQGPLESDYLDDPIFKPLFDAVEEYANQDKWISAKKLPNAKKVGNKVLLFRKMNDSQKEMSTCVYDTFLVKHCDPETTFWQPLPAPPKQ